jgi:hypothetical protein
MTSNLPDEKKWRYNRETRLAVAELAGMAMIIWGIWQWSPPAAAIAAGLFTLLGVYSIRARRLDDD